MRLCDMFRGVATCTVGNGTSVLFWKDVWNNNHLDEAFPRLFSFAKNQDISVAEFLQNNIIEDQFHTPLSNEAFQEYQELQNLIQNLQIQEKEKDKWHYIWGTDRYSSKKFYNLPYKNIKPPPPFQWIWNS
jgi:hypothetical protein